MEYQDRVEYRQEREDCDRGGSHYEDRQWSRGGRGGSDRGGRGARGAYRGRGGRDSNKNFSTLAGINMGVWTQHATRSATIAHLRAEKSMTLSQICRTADWSQTSGVMQ